MKKTFLILVLFSTVQFCFAQQLQLDNYGEDVRFAVKNNFLFIQNQEKIDSFALLNNSKLENAKDSTAIINALKFKEEQLKKVSKKYLNDENNIKQQLLIEKLIERAKQLEENQIVFIDTLKPVVETQLHAIDDEQEAEQVTQSSFSKNILPLCASLLLGLALGLFLARWFFCKKNNASPPSTNTTTTNNATNKDDKLNEQLEKLKKEYQNLFDLHASDKKYFSNAFERIIVPFEKALNDGDEKKLIELLFVAAAHFSSIARFKLEKKQSFDSENVQIILNNKSLSQLNFPMVDAQVSPDNIPLNIKLIIRWLKEKNANEIANVIIAGYKIQNL